MAEEQTSPPATADTGDITTDTQISTPNSGGGNRPRPNRTNDRLSAARGSSEKDFAGATPQIGGVLGLRSENVTRKIPFDVFLEKMETYIMNEMRQGEHLVDITKGHNVDVVATFESTQKPTAIDESTDSEIDKEILKEEIK